MSLTEKPKAEVRTPEPALPRAAAVTDDLALRSSLIGCAPVELKPCRRDRLADAIETATSNPETARNSVGSTRRPAPERRSDVHVPVALEDGTDVGEPAYPERIKVGEELDSASSTS